LFIFFILLTNVWYIFYKIKDLYEYF